ncbi:hypothetical protein GGR43_001215 [Sphingobium jiangsuense]|uniref:Kazal-like domain-containing protein n=1 Tax=Sphingobium jiangsuense TaxID=870476 RepID=A0A7W6BIE6_9SPHN|nr:hypothetical protein [Sphingobium jiangsuense]MBB3925502.1 hypothetical protein [Sphingobium jiangsuense]
MTRKAWTRAMSAGALGALVLLTGCYEDGRRPGQHRPPYDRPDYDRPGHDRPGRDRPQACTREYAPVCAIRGNRERTFSNSCMARADGYRVIADGQCRSGGRH